MACPKRCDAETVCVSVWISPQGWYLFPNNHVLKGTLLGVKFASSYAQWENCDSEEPSFGGGWWRLAREGRGSAGSWRHRCR